MAVTRPPVIVHSLMYYRRLADRFIVQRMKGDYELGENSGEIRVFEPGQDLFKQGDPGGDLLFIREGEVEVFLEQEADAPINLATLGQGEVLGLLTCLDKSARTASARAKGSVTALLVKYEQFQNLLSACPEWLKTILKELTVRVTQMNGKYAQALLAIRKLKTTQVNAIYTGTQILSALPVVGQLCSITLESRTLILFDEFKHLMESVLTRPRSEIDAVFEAFLKSGLLRTEVEAEKKRKAIDLELAKQAAAFTKFTAEARTGKARRLVNAKLTAKDFAQLRGLIKFAKFKNIETRRLLKIPLEDMRAGYTEATTLTLDEVLLQRATRLGIIDFVGDKKTGSVAFAPMELSRTLMFAETFGMLGALAGRDAGPDLPVRAKPPAIAS